MSYNPTPTVPLPHLRELKVTLWHLEEAALVQHLLYPIETEVTLLWQNSDFLHVDHSALFARAMQTLHRTRGSFTISHCHIALDDHAASLFLGSNTASSYGIHIDFYPRDAHRLCDTLYKQGFLADVDRLQYHMLSGQHFMDHTGLLQGATRVRTLELMRLDVMDQIALCASDVPFPELQHLIIVPPPRLGGSVLPITSKTKHAVLGLDDFLRGRRSVEHPIRDLTLCPSAQIPHLITKIRKDMPELALHLT
ncbi:hypothetical protein EIP86_006598 [Pleurotus ostreatoroseus]|nr:hypothetical protein EIP86_006598 [Pleurotus ostreatoroseus]